MIPIIRGIITLTLGSALLYAIGNWLGWWWVVGLFAYAIVDTATCAWLVLGEAHAMTPVWVYTSPDRQFPWHVLRYAIPGGRISTLCLAGDGFTGAVPYGPLLISTDRPQALACPACERELDASTAGAAVAVEPRDELDIAREPTADLRGPHATSVDAVNDWREE